METRKNKSSYYLLIISLFFAHFLIDAMLGIWPVYKTIAGLDLAAAGLITGLCAIIGEGSQMIFGMMGDKGYYRKIAALGLVLVSSSIFYVYTQSYSILFLLFFVTYLGSGAFHPSGAGLISSMTEQRHRRLLITLYMMGGAMGLAISQIVFTKIYFHFEGKIAFLAAIPVLFAFFLFFYSTELERETLSKREKRRLEFKQFYLFFKNRNLRLLYIIQVCNQGMLWAIIFLLPDVLESRGYDAWIRYGGGHMCFSLGFGLMMVPASYLSKYVSEKSTIALFTSLGAISCYFFLFAPHLSNSVVMTLLLLLGSSIGAVNPLVLSLGNQMVPESPGAISAFLMGIAWCIAESVGPGGGGLLTALFETDAASKSLQIMGLSFFGSLWAIYQFEGKENRVDTIENEMEKVLIRYDK